MRNLLIDTNIFLEILLDQEKKEQCKIFLQENNGLLYISDFSLHSIGVILLRNNKEDIFSKFTNDVLPGISIASLSREKYNGVAKIASKYNLDFDDSYQTCISMNEGFEIITLDKDFKRVEGLTGVRFLDKKK